MPTVRSVIAPALLVAAGTASAQLHYEVSDDGLTQAYVEARPDDGSVFAPRGAPFGATADWELNLRRQVGGLQIADMNGDGLNDLAVGCYRSNSFPPYDDWHDMIFYNTGTALETSPSWIASDHMHTGDLQIGDINLDGFQDLFVVTGGTAYSPVRIYFGTDTGPSTSPGWLATPPRSGWPTSGLLFDADNDGDLDAVTTNQALSPDPFRPMHFFRNTAGALETSPSWVSAEQSIQNGLDAADVDGDGFMDVGVAKWVNFETAIYQNVAGTLATTPFWTTGDIGTDKGVAFADVDGNGWVDLGVGHDEPSWLFGNDAGSLSLVWSSDAPFYSQQEVRFADVDHDGDDDFAEVNFGDGRTHIYLNDGGQLAVQPSWTYDSTTVANAIAFGDVNGDGRLDLAIGFSGDVSVRIFYGPEPPCVADWNGDTLVNTSDFLDYLNDYNAVRSGQPFVFADPDLALPLGTLNTSDFLAFLNAFVIGCP